MTRRPIGLLLIALAVVGLGLWWLIERAGRPSPVAPDLETAAVMRGLIAGPGEQDIVGLYARSTDRLCIVRRGAGYRVGVSVDYGDGVACSARGSVDRRGDVLRVALPGGCTIAARFDRDRIVFPPRVAATCAALCRRRASFAALDVERLSGSTSEAAAMRTATGQLPCGDV